MADMSALSLPLPLSLSSLYCLFLLSFSRASYCLHLIWARSTRQHGEGSLYQAFWA